MAIPAPFIQELLARTDVVEVVGRHVQLKKAGANYTGLCPFHAEKSPSFSVSPTKQFYHCFGCGASGDAIKFLMEHTGATFVEAVHDLAQQNGLPVPEDDASPQERERAAAQRQRQATLGDVLERAGEAYRQHLRKSQRAIGYFKQRGVSGAVAKQFGLGYAPEGWRTLAGVFPDYADPLLVESGLVITGEEGENGAEAKRYDRFRDRVMFPIRNVKGQCIGFGGRVLGDEKPKYLNSPETPVFSKGRELYGLFEARAALRELGYALVTEGYMDVVALAQLGFPNAVATLGTACTPEHVHKLFRFTDSVIFSFDGDAAGRRAARKALDAALPHATDVRSVKFLFLPAEHDPDSYIRAFGRDTFARCISEAVPLSRFLVDAAREGCDLATAEGRARLAANARPLWTMLPDGALKRQLLAELAQLVQLDAHELAQLWDDAPARPGLAARRSPERHDPADREDWHAHDHDAWQGPAEDDHRNSSNRRPYGKNWKDWKAKTAESHGWRPRPLRRQPPTSADQAVRLLLADSGAWDGLTHEDHALLCALPAPHGPLFAWIEGQLHEHGPRPWPELQAALGDHPSGAMALQSMERAGADAVPPADESVPSTPPPAAPAPTELRALLDRMLIDHLKALESEAIEAMKTDPEARERYRELQARRLLLEQPPRPALEKRR